MKILIVENDQNRQRQLRTILSSIGHKSGDIESFGETKAALSSLRKKRFDCAFVVMNESLDGLHLLKEIRAGSYSRTLPVVMYSDEVTKERIVAASEVGATNFLAYPFSVSDVENVLSKLQ